MKLIAQSPIIHDGKEYRAGQALTIKDDDQAQALIDAGAAIELVEEGKAGKSAE